MRAGKRSIRDSPLGAELPLDVPLPLAAPLPVCSGGILYLCGSRICYLKMGYDGDERK